MKVIWHEAVGRQYYVIPISALAENLEKGGMKIRFQPSGKAICDGHSPMHELATVVGLIRESGKMPVCSGVHASMRPRFRLRLKRGYEDRVAALEQSDNVARMGV